MERSNIFSEQIIEFLKKKKIRENKLVYDKEKKDKKYDVNNFKVYRTNELNKNTVHFILQNEKKDGANKNQIAEHAIRHNNIKDGKTENGDEIFSKNFDNSPILKIKNIKLKINKYLDKCHDVSNEKLKKYHIDVNKIIDEIKEETLIRTSLLQKNLQTSNQLIDEYIQKSVTIKWDNPNVGFQSLANKKDNYQVAIKYYENTFLFYLDKNFIKTTNNTLDNPLPNNGSSRNSKIENGTETGNFQTIEEIKMHITQRMKEISNNWVSVENIFTKLNEDINNFILYFEKKYEDSKKDINKKIQELESQLKETIYYTNNEINVLIDNESEKNNIFIELLNYFNDYILHLYKYIYNKYKECENIFYNILYEHDHNDNCYVYLSISENYINNLKNEKFLKYIINMFENNYVNIYNDRINKIKKDEYFVDFFILENSQDFFTPFNQYYENYMNKYEQIERLLISYKNVTFKLFFDFTNFNNIIKNHTKKKRELTKDQPYNTLSKLKKRDGTKNLTHFDDKKLKREIYEQYISNILNYYNAINLRDDYFLLTFFEFLENLKSCVIMSYIEIQKNITHYNNYCKIESNKLKKNYDILYNKYNINVKKCMNCTDYIQLTELHKENFELAKNIQLFFCTVEENANSTNNTFVTKLKEKLEILFLSILKKAKIISTGMQEAIIVEKKNKSTKKKNYEHVRTYNDTDLKVTKQEKENSKKIIKNIEKDSTNMKQISISEDDNIVIKQLIGEEINYKYIFDFTSFFQTIYDNYKNNIKTLLCSKEFKSKNNYPLYKKNEKNKTQEKRHRKKKACNLQTNGGKIKISAEILVRNMLHQFQKKKDEELAKREQLAEIDKTQKDISFLNQDKNDEEENDNIPIDELNYDNIMYNIQILKKMFEEFLQTYYTNFKDVLFEHMLKIKENVEQEEYTKYFEKIYKNDYIKTMEENEKAISQIAENLKSKFIKNKENFDNLINKLNNLINEYTHVIDDQNIEESLMKSLNKVNKLFLKMEKQEEKNYKREHQNDCEYGEDFDVLVNNFKNNYKNFQDKLQNMINELNKEIKKVQTYYDMVIKIKEKNIDIEEIKKCLQNSINFRQNIIKKKNDIQNLYNSNIYIFNNKIKAIQTNNATIKKVTKNTLTSNETITYLHAKEEIKNVILIFYFLLYHIKNSISITKIAKQNNTQSGGTSKLPSPIITLPGQVKKTSIKSSIREEKSSHKDETKASTPQNKKIIPNPICDNKKEIINTNEINIKTKFEEIDKHIYNKLKLFQKIKNIYELRISTNSILDNIFLSTIISKNINSLLFSKNGNPLKEEIDHVITFSTQNNKANKEFLKVSDDFKGSEKKIDKENSFEKKNETALNLVDAENDVKIYIENILTRKKYSDLKFFLYTCIYIISIITKILTPYNNNFFKEKTGEYNHVLFIYYDISYLVYKNYILQNNEKIKNNNLKELYIQKDTISSYIYYPNNMLYKIKLFNLYNFEKKVVEEFLHTHFYTLSKMQTKENKENPNWIKIREEYMPDVYTLSTYLKVVSKKVAYFAFKEVYDHHSHLSSQRIDIMQQNFVSKFEETSEELEIKDDVPDTILMRKAELYKLFNLYIIGIKNILSNHLYSLYENLYSNFIFFVYLLNMLPCNSGLDQNENKISVFEAYSFCNIMQNAKTAQIAFRNLFKTPRFPSPFSSDDLSDIKKKVESVYGINYEKKKKINEAKISNNINKEQFHMPYNNEHSYIVNKLERKIEKYMLKFYADITKKMDTKKIEIIKIISNDKKNNRKYYE
ncbi:conserved Plasmodium protein, unknown function [Plasmodium chabaudi adami]|uniref:Uncharacterized protein n=1 Tax=Plasmodium chabaudi adami TaxID=5826 RepID=A0A1D3LHV6_PLACE|nr:conserved Plasmodium protein, unknown function [Plasmodium chabaudi adami]